MSFVYFLCPESLIFKNFQQLLDNFLDPVVFLGFYGYVCVFTMSDDMFAHMFALLRMSV